jgi:hypothetical protein
VPRRARLQVAAMDEAGVHGCAAVGREPLDDREVEGRGRRAVRAGFGRIVVSETEAPNLLVNLV